MGIYSLSVKNLILILHLPLDTKPVPLQVFFLSVFCSSSLIFAQGISIESIIDFTFSLTPYAVHKEISVNFPISLH